MKKYHYSPITKKAEKCSSPDNCKYKDSNGGKHYDSIEEANEHINQVNEVAYGKFAKLARKVFPKTYTTDEHGIKDYGEIPVSKKEQEKALSRLRGEDQIFRAAEFRHFNGETAYTELIDNFPIEEIEKYNNHHLSYMPLTAKITLLQMYGDDSPVAGLSINEGLSTKIEKQVTRMKQASDNGFEKDSFTYTEDENGVAVFAFKDTEMMDHETLANKRKRTLENEIAERINYQIATQETKELIEKYKGKIDPLPTDRDELLEAAAKYEKEESFQDKVPINPVRFKDYEGLSISSNDPAMKYTMRKLVEANESGNLRATFETKDRQLGFYDVRDVSSQSLQREKVRDIKTIEARTKVDDVRSKLSQDGGSVYAISPQVNWDGDTDTTTYWLNYNPPYETREEVRNILGEDAYSAQISGSYTRKELEQIANHDYSPVRAKHNK